MWWWLSKSKKLIEDANKKVKYRCVKGSKRDKDDTGIQGEIDPTGPQGPRGEIGSTTIVVGMTEMGDTSSEASVTNVGTNQDIVLNFKIPKGLKGYTGPKGDIGPQGLPGKIGRSEMISIGETETVEPDETALVQMILKIIFII